jgi:hypothetical protein
MSDTTPAADPPFDLNEALIQIRTLAPIAAQTSDEGIERHYLEKILTIVDEALSLREQK